MMINVYALLVFIIKMLVFPLVLKDIIPGIKSAQIVNILAKHVQDQLIVA